MGLQIEHVTKTFGAHRAVDGVSFAVEPGQLYGYLGANGAGKTTTFRMILGLLQPTEGTITWNGRPIDDRARKEIGYLPEERGLYPKMTVEDQLIYFAQLRGMTKRGAKQSLAQWLERFDIESYRKKKVEELSKGNQQKVQVLSAVLHEPELLILDEPFSGLDPVNVELLKEAVRDIQKRGAAIVFSSHRMDHAEELCDRLSILTKGKQVVEGTLESIQRADPRRRIRLHTDVPVERLETIEGIERIERVPEGAIFHTMDESLGQMLLREAMKEGTVTHFEVERASLEQIFIEKVGESHA